MKDNYYGYMYVLNFSDNTICQIKITEELDKLDTEDIFNSFGMSIDECQVMYTNA